MGQKQSTEQFNFNTLISTLVESRTDEGVIKALLEYQKQTDGLSILPDYLSDLIAMASLVFMISSLVCVYFIRRELKEHKINCSKNTDKQDRNMVRNTHHIGTINSIQFNNINFRPTKVRKRKLNPNSFLGKKMR